MRIALLLAAALLVGAPLHAEDKTSKDHEADLTRPRIKTNAGTPHWTSGDDVRSHIAALREKADDLWDDGKYDQANDLEDRADDLESKLDANSVHTPRQTAHHPWTMDE